MYTNLGFIMPTVNIPTVPTPQPTFWQKLNNTVSTITDKVKQVQPVVSKAQDLIAQLKAKQSGSTSSTGSGYTPPGAPQPAPGMSTTTKVVIGVAVAATVAGIVYAITPKKKGMGEIPETKSKAAQRVLKLMDKDYTYLKALKKSLYENKNVSRVKLERELNKYI